MAPTRPFVVDEALSAIAIGYTNPAQTLIADRALPRVPVGGEKFKWLKYPLAEGFTVPDTRVGRTGRVNRIEFTAIEDTESVEDYGLDAPIPQSDIDEAARMRGQGLSTFDPERHATMMQTNLLLLDREVRVASLIQNPAVYPTGRKLLLSGTSQFNDYVNSDPIGVIKSALEGTLVYRPNKLVMGQAVWSPLSTHPHLVNALRGNLMNKGIISREEMARLFEVQEVLVGESYVNTARPGQSPTLARTWGKHLAALYVDPVARPEGGVTFGYTAQYGSRIAGRIEDENVGLQGGTVIRAGERVKELVCAPDVGFLIQNAVA